MYCEDEKNKPRKFSLNFYERKGVIVQLIWKNCVELKQVLSTSFHIHLGSSSSSLYLVAKFLIIKNIKKWCSFCSFLYFLRQHSTCCNFHIHDGYKTLAPPQHYNFNFSYRSLALTNILLKIGVQFAIAKVFIHTTWSCLDLFQFAKSNYDNYTVRGRWMMTFNASWLV